MEYTAPVDETPLDALIEAWNKTLTAREEFPHRPEPRSDSCFAFEYCEN